MSKTITLPDDLVTAIDAYLDTDWSDGRDPSKFGALNAVAFIGERVAAIYRESQVQRCSHGAVAASVRRTR